MQTFLPYVNDFYRTAEELDSKRLNKQLLEGRQIYAALSGRSRGWVNHPATKMWHAHENLLVEYLRAIRHECVARGIKTENNWNAILEMHEANYDRGVSVILPHWATNPDTVAKIEITHKGNLYKKDPIYYAQYEDAFHQYQDYVCCDGCNYFWVTHTYAKEFSYV